MGENTFNIRNFHGLLDQAVILYHAGLTPIEEK